MCHYIFILLLSLNFMMKNGTNSSRGFRSHDQRALPDIPPRNSEIAKHVAVDLDDIPEEHYDIIPKKISSTLLPSSSEVTVSEIQNAYEPVPDDRPSTLLDQEDEPNALYSMVNEPPRSKSVIIRSVNRDVTHPYETVNVQTYAQIDRKRNTISGPPVKTI